MGAVKLRERGSNFSVQLGLIAGIGLLFRIPYAIAERHNTALGDGVVADKARIRSEFPYFGEPHTRAEQADVTPAPQHSQK